MHKVPQGWVATQALGEGPVRLPRGSHEAAKANKGPCSCCAPGNEHTRAAWGRMLSVWALPGSASPGCGRPWGGWLSCPATWHLSQNSSGEVVVLCR